MIERVFQLEPNTSIDKSNSYIVSYPHMAAYFERHDPLHTEHLICGTLMVYGWMPTVLRSISSTGSIGQLAGVLTRVRKNGNITNQEIARVTQLTNNSLVGASKLLHFLAPDKFAIWDSKIYAFIHERYPHHYQVQNVSKFRDYHRDLEALCSHPEFPAFHNRVRKKIGYDVSRLRALEVVMFQNARSRNGS